MNNSSIFAAQFAAASLNSLVASFNHEVGNHGWCSARASYDHALIAEFLRRGINVSAIYDGSSISFAKPVSLQDNTLIYVNNLSPMIPSALGIIGLFYIKK